MINHNVLERVSALLQSNRTFLSELELDIIHPDTILYPSSGLSRFNAPYPRNLIEISM